MGTADRFILSDGHKCLELYGTLIEKGFEEPIESSQRSFKLGKGEILLNSGKQIAIAVTGTLTADALTVGNNLNEMGYGVTVLNFPTVKPLDLVLLKNAYRKSKILITLEEHSIIGGFGSAVLEALASENNGSPIHVLGIIDGSTNTGPYRELLEAYGLTGEKVVERILKELNQQ